MRTAITVAKTHDGKWVTLGYPEDSLTDQKKNFRALRADKSHPDFALVIYQESDGHAEVNRLLTPEEAKANDKQRAKDAAEAKKFHKERAEVKEKDPVRRKAAEEFEQRAKQAEADELYAKENNIPVHEVKNHRGDKEKKVEKP